MLNQQFGEEGQRLIGELKGHLLTSLNNLGGRAAVADLEIASGLTVPGPGGQNVFHMGAVTLMIELVKEGRLVGPGLNTRDWLESTIVKIP